MSPEDYLDIHFLSAAMISTLTKFKTILDMACVGVFVTRNETTKNYGHSSVLVHVIEIMWSIWIDNMLA